MGLMDKIMFWKHDDDSFSKPPGQGFGLDNPPGMGTEELPGRPPDLGIQEQSFGQEPDTNYGDPSRGFVPHMPQEPSQHQQSQHQPFGQQNFQQGPEHPAMVLQPESNEDRMKGYHEVRPPSQGYGGGGQQSDSDYMISKNIEVLSSKMDAIRAAIESINQRLANIERIAQSEHDDKGHHW